MRDGGRTVTKQRGFITPTRLVVACCIVLVVLFYGSTFAFHDLIEGQHSSATRLHLNGFIPATKSAADGSRLILPTRERYHGPIDLDDLAAARAEEINATWMASTDKSWWLQPGYHLSFTEDYPPYPFQRIKKGDGHDTGVIAIIAPFYDMDYYKAEMARSFFWRLKANGHIIIVITSYQEFPGRIENPFDDRHTTPQDQIIYEAVDGFVHCLREPDRVLPSGVPRILLSESDFHDPERRDGGGSLKPWGLPKEWDLFYNNQGGHWNDYARNWTLAKACFKRLIMEMNIKIVVMGRDLTKEEDYDLAPLIASGHITSHQSSAEWKNFLRYIESSRVLFAPNVHDASPRVLVEALCLNVPILVNRHILGGWKYVTQDTGAFFESVDDVVPAFQQLLARQSQLRPREWFRENWGKERAIYRLQAFLELAVGIDRLQAAEQLATAKITY